MRTLKYKKVKLYEEKRPCCSFTAKYFWKSITINANWLLVYAISSNTDNYDSLDNAAFSKVLMVKFPHILHYNGLSSKQGAWIHGGAQPESRLI